MASNQHKVPKFIVEQVNQKLDEIQKLLDEQGLELDLTKIEIENQAVSKKDCTPARFCDETCTEVNGRIRCRTICWSDCI